MQPPPPPLPNPSGLAGRLINWAVHTYKGVATIGLRGGRGEGHLLTEWFVPPAWHQHIFRRRCQVTINNPKI